MTGIYYGGDYNPDQWPEDVWPEDVRLMQEAGVNLVSLGIFAWSRLQPTADRFDFGWLDRVLDLLHEGGIGVDLATATASPPPWLARAHTEMLPVLADGVQLWPGARQHYCPSSIAYREAAAALVERIAERYGKHPALVMWHVGNEFGCHVPACYCDRSAAAFREWLKNRYQDLDALNAAWGTDFWSQRYSDWEEILPPRRTPTWPNPSQQLDFHRFCSDELLACYEQEHAILKRHTPEVPVTTNFMSFFKPLDYWKWAQREDVVSNDSYPDPGDPASPMKAAMAGDLMRSLKRGQPWLLMEQTPSRVNWREINLAKAPGQYRLWSYQALARGAGGVLCFQWRQSRAGAEKFHSAMVPHGPRETSPTWQEVVRLGTELKELSALQGTPVEAEVAILHAWDSWWALELPSKPSLAVRQVEQLESYYRPLWEANVAVDFAPPARDLSKYKLVLAPSLYLVSDEAVKNLVAYVEAGGVLVLSFFSGIVDPSDHIRLGGYPAPFRELLGLRVEDWLPLAAGQEIAVAAGGGAARADLWSELLSTQAATVLATFQAAPLYGKPAATKHPFGRGAAYYLATRLDPAAMAGFLRGVWTEAGVTPTLQTPGGVEAVRRGGKLFLLNHRPEAVDVVMAPGGDPVRLEPHGVALA
ncbi:MAG TPA: beta-galactosidase [Candidatus Dormibacteraeota bacterium]